MEECEVGLKVIFLLRRDSVINPKQFSLFFLMTKRHRGRATERAMVVRPIEGKWQLACFILLLSLPPRGLW
jgi:hypothetical protein